MAGFIYNGKSTANILSKTELVLCSTDGGVSAIPGMTRSLMGGEPTISRPIVNEYGTITDHLEFTYSLIKADTTFFTYDEQIAIERWLTSPKFSSPIFITDCDGNIRYKYFGKFTMTQWYPIDDGFYAMDFTFSVNGSYAYEHHNVVATIPEDAPIDEEDGSPDWSFIVNCITDELEEWVYPKLTVHCEDTEANASFSITNITDNNNVMKVTTDRHDEFFFDCQHCIISDESGKVNFKELGWDDVDNIYWLRFKAGNNEISVHGSPTITIDYDSPVKISGGWLV